MKSELGVESLDWPGNSPDLNPIENVWALMSAKIKKEKPKSMLELMKTIEKVWFEDITTEYLEALYDSMPNRVKCVIKAKGGTTKY